MSPVDVIPDEDIRPSAAAPTRSPLATVGLVLHVIGWAIAAGLLVIVFFRIVAWDDIQYFAYADSLGLILYLPAWVVGVAAGVTRKWFLLGACLLVVAAQLVFGLPELTAATPVPAAARDAFKFRVFDANVYQGNTSMTGYIAQIRAYHPDLVTMEECPPSDVTQLEQSGALRGLPYRFAVSRSGARAFFIASRYPLGPSTVSSLQRHFPVGSPAAVGGGPGGGSGGGFGGGPGGGSPGGFPRISGSCPTSSARRSSSPASPSRCGWCTPPPRRIRVCRTGTKSCRRSTRRCRHASRLPS